MHIDFSTLTPRQSSKLITATVTPRPIALVTTVDSDGRRNAAPYSFFNAMSSWPPILTIGLEDKGGGAAKDTYRNIRDTREFAVHLVDQALAEAMNITATDVGPEVDELSEAGLETREATAIKAPLIIAAPVAFECRLHSTVDLSEGRCIAVGEILHMHLRDEILDAETYRLDTTELDLIARLNNPGWYARTTDVFQLRRMSPEQLEEKKKAGLIGPAS